MIRSGIVIIAKRFLCAAFFFIISAILYGQGSEDQALSLSDSLPSNFRRDPESIRAFLYQQVPAEYKTGIYEKISWRYAVDNAKGDADYLQSGDIYHNWPELTDYLNKVFRQILPDSLKDDENLTVVVSKDGLFNAYMLASGVLVVNLGVFDDITDEATLAAIFAHELSHYLLKHSFYYYIDDESGKFDLGLHVNDRVRQVYREKFELQADSLAMQVLRSSDYHISGLISAFEIMAYYDRNTIARSIDDWKVKNSDHPAAGVRYNKLINYYNKFKDEPGEQFIVSDSIFDLMKKKSRSEILKNCLAQYEYSECIEKAFKFHLFEPARQDYYWYIMESIRLLCYQDRSRWKALFINDRYYDTINDHKIRVKRPCKKSFLEEYNPDILPMKTEDFSQIKAKYYWAGEVQFRTYEEAFDYFMKLGLKYQDRESRLTNALSYSHDTTSRNILLNKYLSLSGIKHRDFAWSLLTDSLYDKLPAQKLIVLNIFQIGGIIGQDKVPLLCDDEQLKDQLKIICDSLRCMDKNTEFIYLPELTTYNMKEYNVLQNLQLYSVFPAFSRRSGINPYIVNPEIWEYFNLKGINEVVFINCLFYKEIKPEKTLDPYWKFLQQTPEQILAEDMTDKYLDVLISNICCKKKEEAALSYYSGSVSLGFKKKTQEAIISEINNQYKKFVTEAHKYNLQNVH